MNRILSAVLSLAMTFAVGGVAFAKTHHHTMSNATMMSGHTMSGHSMKHHGMKHRSHKYGNDKARCRDAKGRFVKLTNGRCLAK